MKCEFCADNIVAYLFKKIDYKQNYGLFIVYNKTLAILSA